MDTQEIPYGYCQCGCGQQTNIAKVTRANRGWFKGQPMPFVVTHYIPTYGTPQERFWKGVNKDGPNGCWLWTGQLTKAGYGTISIGGVGVYTHRFSYELHNVPIPPGMYICHSCDTPACCNPSHLFLGTQQDNVQDMHNKERAVNPPRMQGSKHHQAKLDESQVREIRERVARGEKRIQLARLFDVTRVTIDFIVNRKTWQHIP